tara:strand:- start:64 stop:765 length:702 start_codon:yes stop_codon:yes gene_type:complete
MSNKLLVNHYNDGFPYIVVDNFYDESELNLIWREFDFLLDKLFSPEVVAKNATSAATDGNGEILKKNNSVFLDEIYQCREFSDILQCNRKLFHRFAEILKENKSWWFQCLREDAASLNEDTTLVSYYEDNGYYKAHWDKALLTSCTWFYREPKCFDGGDFILNAPYWKEHVLNNSYPPATIESKNNRIVLFPSFIPHQVTPISIKEQHKNERGVGRFTITNFLGSKELKKMSK